MIPISRDVIPSGSRPALRDQTSEYIDYTTVTESFGEHIKRLREVRRLTQEDLSERSGLAVDTIRRLERRDFSPSLRTVRKIGKGLGMSISTMFNSFELEEVPAQVSRITTLLAGRSNAELDMIERLLTEILVGLDEYKSPSASERAGP